MKAKILNYAAKLGKKMADGLTAEPGAPERHRANGVEDAYQLLQEEFPELFDGSEEPEDESPEEVAKSARERRKKHRENRLKTLQRRKQASQGGS